jgi:hypothetical protein
MYAELYLVIVLIVSFTAVFMVLLLIRRCCQNEVMTTRLSEPSFSARTPIIHVTQCYLKAEINLDDLVSKRHYIDGAFAWRRFWEANHESTRIDTNWGKSRQPQTTRIPRIWGAHAARVNVSVASPK